MRLVQMFSRWVEYRYPCAGGVLPSALRFPRVDPTRPRQGHVNKMMTKFGSFVKTGAVIASLALVGAACGGDDGGNNGGGGNDETRAALIELINEEGMPEELLNCFVDTAMEVFDDADMESVLAGGDPSQAAEDAFTEKVAECGG